jgi:hypothetical protein
MVEVHNGQDVARARGAELLRRSWPGTIRELLEHP